MTDSLKLVVRDDIRLGEKLQQADHQIDNSFARILYSKVASLHQKHIITLTGSQHFRGAALDIKHSSGFYYRSVTTDQ